MRSGPAAVLALTAAALLAGCSGDPEPVPTALPPLPSASPSPSSSPPSASPVPLPTEARAATPRGASEFAKYWFNELNMAYMTRDSTRVSRISAKGCKSCVNFASSVEALKREGHTVKGNAFDVKFAEAASAANSGVTLVDVTYTIPGQTEYSSTGQVVRRVPPAGRADFVVSLERSLGSWRLKEIQTP